ncbi:IucA/IucC family protein [Marinobacterium arenosum]|uniref:IucA/IucC family protein n=1 Tax=Marinobacterium arenosum TaxID=2862496 RepID=UPI001C93C64C|nr:IucA/IucC family protein [Marinobacterium arenosum]MBY4676360.1 hypothetical protein [Marinobacterium arenosum]
MNAILPIGARPLPNVSGEDRKEAARNGLFRLLRSLLRERLLVMEAVAEQPGEYRLDSPAGRLLLSGARFNRLGALSDFKQLSWQPLDDAEDAEGAEGLEEPLTALRRVLELRGDSADPAWQRIAAELDNGLRNEALTLAWRRRQDAEIRRQCQADGIDNLLAWARRDGGNGSIRLEQWAAVGHPYHPGCKTKLGLSLDEVWRYAPEFAARVPLALIAVHRSLAKLSRMIDGLDYRAWFARHYPAWFQQWQGQLPDHDDYLPLPVHPWQLEHDLPQRFADELAAGLIRLTDARFAAAPTLSFRTLAPAEARQAPYIKLPVAAQMTSSVRNLSSPSVENAARISAVLQDIFGQRPDIATALRCQWDELGLHLQVDSESRDDARYLAVLFRRNPCRLLADDEQAVVVAALFVPSPLSGQPLLIELMRQAGVGNAGQARDWFRRYCDLLFAGVLQLYLDYGIALEAHQQNLMAVLDADGQPRGFINRDVGGVCIHRSSLAEQGWPIAFSAASTLVDSRAEARVNISHAVMQSHLGELIELLDGQFGLNAEQLWRDLAGLLDGYLERFGVRHGDSARQQEQQAFFDAPWPGTAFIRMRLQDQSQQAVCEPIPNPLKKALMDHDD